MRFPVAPFLSCISSTLVFACSDDIIAPFSASDTDPSAGTESPPLRKDRRRRATQLKVNLSANPIILFLWLSSTWLVKG